MKRIIVLLGLVASTSGNIALVSHLSTNTTYNSSTWNRFTNQESLIVQSGYEGTNEDGDRESVGTSS